MKLLLIIAISITLSFLMISCTKAEIHDHSSQNHKGSSSESHAHHMNKKGLPKGKLSSDSIFHFDSKWKNQDSKTIMLQHLGGRPQVMAMVYTNCQFVCPRIIADMMIIKSKLSPKQLRETNFVLISIDPKRDTPARLKKYSSEKHLENWTLLSGNENDVLELAATLGVKFKKLPDGEFSHSNIVNIIDKNGVVVHQQIGLGQNPKVSLDRLATLMKE